MGTLFLFPTFIRCRRNISFSRSFFGRVFPQTVQFMLGVLRIPLARLGLTGKSHLRFSVFLIPPFSPLPRLYIGQPPALIIHDERSYLPSLPSTPSTQDARVTASFPTDLFFPSKTVCPVEELELTSLTGPLRNATFPERFLPTPPPFPRQYVSRLASPSPGILRVMNDS